MDKMGKGIELGFGGYIVMNDGYLMIREVLDESVGLLEYGRRNSGYDVGEVVSVGNNCDVIEVGNVVMLERGRGRDKILNGEKYLVYKIENVIGIMS